ncbi:MFS transporter [Oricola cellulosilytica]|uniref:MFS transporter n=1 Tax=Oricola cellulosilytica TaxID=1429082 RepID=A0A4R0P9P7_9HYPH|nr:MFS transporter [Oricola cellulosilytica]TCD13890.1 MFS transporter [Oricola cellulosilytica]
MIVSAQGEHEALLAPIKIILRDPLLRLIVAALFLTSVAVSSVMPYASLVAVELLGLTDAAYSAVLAASSAIMVVASVVVGIVTDQQANRRQMLAVSFAFAAAGYSLVFLTGSPVTFVIAHTALLPLGFSVFSQLFALARLAGRKRGGAHADQIFAVARAAFSLGFVITPPLWSVALASGTALLGVYVSAAASALVCFLLFAIAWPQGEAGQLADPKSGLRFAAAFRELARPGLLVRMLAVGLITGSNQLYMALFGLLIVTDIGGGTPDVGRFHGAIALLEIPFMLACGLALKRMSKPALIAAGGVVYAGFLFLFASVSSMAVAYLLVVPAAIGAAIILSVTISYLQDLLADRPGAGGSLMAVSNFFGHMVAALTFAAGTAVTSYAGTAVAGGMLALVGVAVLLAMDGLRRTEPADA